MELNLSTVLLFVTAFLTGAVAALKFIAPRTKNKYDDKALDIGETVLGVLPKPAAPAKPADTSGVPAGTGVVLHPR